MNRTLSALSFFMFALIILSIPALYSAHAKSQEGPIAYDYAYAFATAQKQNNGATFLKLRNNTDQDRKILSASSDVADRVELHTHSMDEGVMMMREVEHYDLPANGSLVLEPMGHHIMLMGLKNPLTEGEDFMLDLTMDDETVAKIRVTIVKPGTAPDMMEEQEHKHHDH